MQDTLLSSDLAFQPAGAIWFSRGFKEHTNGNLTELELGYNEIKDEGACALAQVGNFAALLLEAVVWGTPLPTLAELGYNKIKDEGACALAQVRWVVSAFLQWVAALPAASAAAQPCGPCAPSNITMEQGCARLPALPQAPKANPQGALGLICTFSLTHSHFIESGPPGPVPFPRCRRRSRPTQRAPPRSSRSTPTTSPSLGRCGLVN